MSWYTDPQLFIYSRSEVYWIARITGKYDVPLLPGDRTYVEEIDFSKHLSLGNNINKESDYDALKSILAKNSYPVNWQKVMHVNRQGLVVYWNWSTDTGTWSREERINSIINSLPANVSHSEKKISELVAEISSLKNIVTNLQDQQNQEKNDRQALQTQVHDLTSKLEEYRSAGSGSANVEPWMSRCTVPSKWVPFEELDVLNIPKDTPLTITEAPGAPEFAEDTTTNVQANHFRQGNFPVVAVNVADLNPNNGKARFDPDIWCSLNSAENSYAARKLSESEMSFDPHTRC